MKKRLAQLGGLFLLFLMVGVAFAQTITNVYVASQTATTATIVWTTNTPATSQVVYGLNTPGSYPYSTPVNQTLVTSHSVTMIVLTPGQAYNFAAVSGSTQSAGYQFTMCGGNSPAFIPATGTVNNYYQYGSFTMTWNPPTGSSGTPTVCGQAMPTTASGPLSGGASLAASVGDSYKATPGPGTWTIRVQDIGDLSPISVTYPLSAQNSDISAQLSAAAAMAGLVDVIANTITQTCYPAFVCSGGGGSGFPIHLGSTLIAANSTTTAVTGLEVNGVTLTAAGSASLFLNQAGGYTAPGGGVTSIIPSTNITCSPEASGSCVGAVTISASGGSGSCDPMTAGYLLLSTVGGCANSTADYGLSTSGTYTFPAPIAITDTTLPSQISFTPNSHAAATVAGAASLGVPSTVTTPSVLLLPAAPCTGYLEAATDTSGIMPITCGTPSGGLPSATAPGQIISSTAAGTIYAPQGQIFYNQTSDTIPSIEAECSSLCTYVVTVPQTITLSANHTLSSNVQLAFQAGGEWTVSGAFTLTIPGNVSGTLNQHFAKASGASLLLENQAEAAFEWFGAVGDWNGTTGTDNTAAMQFCLDSMQHSAGNCTLRGAGYAVSAALTIASTSFGEGINGVNTAEKYYAPTTLAGSVIVSTSATADILDVNAGWNSLHDFVVMRSVAPSGGVTNGILLNAWGQGSINRVASEDSNNAFHIMNSTGAGGLGVIENALGEVGYNGFSETSGTFTMFNVDSSNGTGNPSLRLRHSGFFVNSTVTGATSYNVYAHGSLLADIMGYGLESGGNVNYCVYLEDTGGGAGVSDADIHFYGTICDEPQTVGIYTSGIAASENGSVEFNGGSIQSLATGSQAFSINSSSGVSIHSMDIGGTMTTDGTVSSSSNISVTDNNFFNVPGVGISATGTTGSVFANNTMRGAGASTLIALASTSTNNSVTGNSLDGTATNGVTFDSSSGLNTGIYTNAFSASLTNPVVNSSTSNQLTLLGGATNLPLVVVSSSTTNAGIVLQNTTSKSWIPLVVGSAGPNAGDLKFYDNSDSTTPLDLFSTGANLFYTLNILPSSGISNGLISFGANYGADAIDLYASGSNKYGWGLNGGEMQFFAQDNTSTHFSFNAASGGLQASGTNEYMRVTPRTSSGSLTLASGMEYCFSSSTTSSASNDVCITHPSTGVVNLPNGTTGTTQSSGDNTTKVATDAFVLANAGGGGPSDTTLTVGTGSITANSCNTVATVTMTGLTTGMTVTISPASDVSAVNGWSPNEVGQLYFIAWPSASNTLSYYVCNPTLGNLAPGSSTTWNVSAK